MDDVNIASIRATTYEDNIDNITDNAYCAHVYNTPSNTDGEFASAINQWAEISNMMGYIGIANKSDKLCELFSDPIIGQLKEL